MRRAGRLAVILLPAGVVALAAWRLVPRTADETPPTPGTSAGLDDDGDPLPPFAVRRFGTKRLHFGGAPSAITDDGLTVVSGHRDGTVRVWDVATGRVRRELAAFPEHVPPPARSWRHAFDDLLEPPRPEAPDPVGDVDVSADGRWVAASNGWCVRVLDTATGVRHTEWARARVAVSELWCGTNGTVVVLDHARFLWTVELGATRATVLPRPIDHRVHWHSVLRSCDDRTFVLVEGSPATVAATFVDPAAGTTRRLPMPDLQQWNGAPSPGEPRRVAWWSWQDEGRALRVRVLDPATDETTADFTVAVRTVAPPRWSSDGRRILLPTEEGTRALDAASGADLGVVAASPAGPAGVPARRGVTDIWHQRVVFDVDTGAEVHPVGGAHAFLDMGWSPAEDVLALVGLHGELVFADAGTGNVRGRSSTRPSWVRPFLFAPDGGSVVTTTHRAPPQRHFVDGRPSVDLAFPASQFHVTQMDGSLRTFTIGAAKDGGVPLEGTTESIQSWCAAPDGRLMAGFLGDEGPLRVWDGRDGTRVADLAGWEKTGLLAFSPDGAFVALAGDEAVLVWDVAAPGAPRTIPTHGFCDVHRSFALAPRAEFLAVVDARGRIHVGTAFPPQRLVTLEGHLEHVTRLEFSGDGHLLASVGQGDGTVLVWDVEAATARR